MIHMTNVRIRYPDFDLAIDDLTLESGMTVVVGRNGSGKTTFLELLSTGIEPDSGEIRYGGMTVKEHLPLIRRNIGFAPSEMELYEDMTPRGFLQYMAGLKGLGDTSETGEWLKKLHLEDISRKPIGRLSQGQKQSVAVAQACLGRPLALLLDEPSSHLDSLERKYLMALLTQYAADRLVVVVTHELGEWDQRADRILWLDSGRVCFHGTQKEWTAGLPLNVYSGIIAAEQLAGIEERNLVRCSIREGKAHIRMIGELPPPGFKQERPSLEDAYFIRRLSQPFVSH
ncbi:ABC transporter ATP-binding protein [Paenibacillus validus]|uniref:ATP-binding cassette domain-containing protein n=1 Tax=Paenibacillus validus TaxID=44253 RepID=UPI000FDAA070|nr:ABC transporter ATP-binding protein [Paenibacillus validus]MED4600987.1 ABC transporter ATP-binding protein [Paenibacillus validus]MED4604966.1 ABC transporter ATP-binding protein [Paenibacillus validus]